MRELRGRAEVAHVHDPEIGHRFGLHGRKRGGVSRQAQRGIAVQIVGDRPSFARRILDLPHLRRRLAGGRRNRHECLGTRHPFEIAHHVPPVRQLCDLPRRDVDAGNGPMRSVAQRLDAGDDRLAVARPRRRVQQELVGRLQFARAAEVRAVRVRDHHVSRSFDRHAAREGELLVIR